MGLVFLKKVLTQNPTLASTITFGLMSSIVSALDPFNNFEIVFYLEVVLTGYIFRVRFPTRIGANNGCRTQIVQ